jgi:mRNA interferase HigB
MHIITHKRLREFWIIHPNSETSLRNWIQITKKANWENLADVRNDLPHTDIVGTCKVFNIGGNNYRLIAKISFITKIVYIRNVLTHSEYDKNNWKPDCSP